jgi:hypothetical protein
MSSDEPNRPPPNFFMRTLRRAATNPLEASAGSDQAGETAPISTPESEPAPLASVQLERASERDSSLVGGPAAAPAKTESMAQEFTRIDASGSALNVAVRGEHVLVLLPSGAEIALSLADAKRSLQRLADAIAVVERAPIQPPT